MQSIVKADCDVVRTGKFSGHYCMHFGFPLVCRCALLYGINLFLWRLQQRLLLLLQIALCDAQALRRAGWQYALVRRVSLKTTLRLASCIAA